MPFGFGRARDRGDPEAARSAGRQIQPDGARRQPISRVDARPATLRFLLDRSSDSASRDEPTQDCLVVEHAPSHLCFAVTDGVGSSFLGQLAARYLAQHLVSWLFALPAVPDERRLVAELTHLLEELSDEADELVETYPVPEQLPDVVRDVLEQQRSYGSETMFVCGRVDWSGRSPARVGLAWLGDARLRVIFGAGVLRDFTGRTSDRWSTSRGPRGSVRTWVGEDADVRRIIACTDGLVPELDAAVELGDAALDARLLTLAGRPASDDMALVDIGLVPGALPPAGGGRAAAPDTERSTREPAARAASKSEDDARLETVATGSATPPGAGIAPPSPRWRLTDRGYELAWETDPGADFYGVQLAGDPNFTNPVDYQVHRTWFAPPALKGPLWMRVRAIAAERAGPWSEGHAMPKGDGSVASPGAGGEELDAPGRLEGRVDRGRVVLRWDIVPDARSYVLRIETVEGQRRRTQTISDVLDSPTTLAMRPGRYRIAVRADAPGREGLWTPSLEVVVP